jgi:hypothetical protein
VTVVPARPPAIVASAPKSPRPEPSAHGEVDSLGREAELLHRARSLLDGNPSGALAVLEVHASEFPTGRLSLEREIIAVDALRRLNRVQEARAKAEALVGRAAGTLYERRVRALLEGLPPQ